MMSFLNWLFPDGLGVRAIIALCMVAMMTTMVAGIDGFQAQDFKEILLFVLGYFFGDRRSAKVENGTNK